MKLLACIVFTIGGFGIGFAINGIFSPKPEMQEYQIRIEIDSAYIYDNGKLIDSCKHGNDGIDSVILKDNL